MLADGARNKTRKSVCVSSRPVSVTGMQTRIVSHDDITSFVQSTRWTPSRSAHASCRGRGLFCEARRLCPPVRRGRALPVRLLQPRTPRGLKAQLLPVPAPLPFMLLLEPDLWPLSLELSPDPSTPSHLTSVAPIHASFQPEPNTSLPFLPQLLP